MRRVGRLAHFPPEWNVIAILLACFQFSYKMSTEELIVWIHLKLISMDLVWFGGFHYSPLWFLCAFWKGRSESPVCCTREG